MTTTTLGDPMGVDGEFVPNGTLITGRCDDKPPWGVLATTVGTAVLVPEEGDVRRPVALGERGGMASVSGRISMMIFPARGGDLGCGRAGILAVLSRRLTLVADGAKL